MSVYNLAFHYYFIEKRTGYCFQYNNSNVPNYEHNDGESYTIEMDGYYNVIGCYLMGGKWFNKVWSEIDEFGDPVSGATFEMVEFTPELVQE